MNAINIGVVGYSSQKFDENIAKALIIKAFDQVEKDFPGAKFTVVSGLTDLGIPGLAYREADKRDWKTVGVACKKAKEHKLYPVDDTKIVGKEWGDESNTFLSMLDVFVKIGGGKQSLAEKEKAKKAGLPIVDFELASTAEK